MRSKNVTTNVTEAEAKQAKTEQCDIEGADDDAKAVKASELGFGEDKLTLLE